MTKLTAHIDHWYGTPQTGAYGQIKQLWATLISGCGGTLGTTEPFTQ